MTHDHSHHDHLHGGAGHHHDTSGASDARLTAAAALNVLLTIIEFALGLAAASLALQADALHNFSDAGALVVALIARRIGRRGADHRFTFGYKRAELVGAMINLTTLIVIGAGLIGQAALRFLHPQSIEGAIVMGAAGAALVINVLTAWLLWSMSKGNLNLRAAFAHNVMDALTSVAVLLGGVAIATMSWTWVDPALTLLIGGLTLAYALRDLKTTSSILMNGAPVKLEMQAMIQSALRVPGVVDVHHVHAWTPDENNVSVEAHIAISKENAPQLETIKSALKRRLKVEFNVTHATLEFEFAEQACADPNHHDHTCPPPPEADTAPPHTH